MFFVLSLYDKKTELFGPLALERSKEAGLRSFGDALKSGQQQTIVDHGEDFDLMLVGMFDENTGSLVPVPAPELVMNAAALIRRLRTPELSDADRPQLPVEV